MASRAAPLPLRTRYASFVSSGIPLRKSICSASPVPLSPARFHLTTPSHFSPIYLDRISFGKGEYFWTNVFPSPLTDRFASDIRKFGRVLNTVKLFEVVLALLPIYALLRLFRLSKDFGERMVYPLAALFFGTGNQTPYVASVILVSTPPTSPSSFLKTQRR